MQWRHFTSTPRAAVTANPFISPGNLSDIGIFLGIDLFTRKAVLFDPWRLKIGSRPEDQLPPELLWLNLQKVKPKIASTIAMFVAVKGAGKTTLMGSLALGLLPRKARLVDDYPRAMKLRIHDRKYEDGKPEYEKITRGLYSDVTYLNKVADINVFPPDMGMEIWDILETAVNLAEYANGDRPLDPLQVLAIQTAVHRMITESRELQGPTLLRMLLGTNTIEHFNDYMKSENRAAIEDSFQEKIDELPDSERRFDLERNLDALARSPQNTTREDFARASSETAADFNRLLTGDFGRVIGDKTSLRKLMGGEVETWDWSGVNVKARAALEAMVMKWEDLDMLKGGFDLTPDICIVDEEPEAFNSAMYLRYRSARTMKARMLPTFDMRAAQDLPRLLEAHDEGSEKRTLAKNIVRGTDIVFIGKQAADSENLQYLSRYIPAEHDLNFTTQLAVGCWAIAIQGRPTIFFKHILTPTQAAMFQSDAAARTMMDAVFWTPKQISDYIHREGYILVGEEEQ